MPRHTLPNTPQIKAYAKKLRKEMTEEERILWSQLRRHSQHYRFRRQYIIGYYIVDFVCLEKKLVIELDGSQHFQPENLMYDLRRTQEIEALGFRVIRFCNLEIRQHLSDVLRVIYFYLSGEI